MNAFGESLNLVFMRWSWWFSSGSMPMDWISDCIPVSSYSPANESLDAFPWVPIPLSMNLWMLEFKSYSPANGLNLRLHSHEFKFLFPCQWISDCIPMNPYSPANESQTAFPWVPIPSKFLESFGWVPSMSCHPDSGMPLGFHQLRPERDFGGTPYNHTWVPLKSIVEHFRALLRDFCFWLGFMRISDSSMHDVQYLCRFYKNLVVWTVDLLRGWSPSGWDSWFRNAPRIPSVASRTRFEGYPYTYHMGTPKIDCRAF